MRPLSILALAAGLAAAAPARAQEPQPPAPQARPHPAQDDFQALGLTDEQKQKLRDIRQQYPDDARARRKAMKAVLTPEQREKLKELRRRRRRAPQD